MCKITAKFLYPHFCGKWSTNPPAVHRRRWQWSLCWATSFWKWAVHSSCPSRCRWRYDVRTPSTATLATKCHIDEKEALCFDSKIMITRCRRLDSTIISYYFQIFPSMSKYNYPGTFSNLGVIAWIAWSARTLRRLRVAARSCRRWQRRAQVVKHGQSNAMDHRFLSDYLRVLSQLQSVYLSLSFLCSAYIATTKNKWSYFDKF